MPCISPAISYFGITDSIQEFRFACYICQFLHIRYPQQWAHSCNIAAIIYLNRCSLYFCRMKMGIERYWRTSSLLQFTITIDEQQCTLDLFDFFFPFASPEFYNKTDTFFLPRQNFVNDAWMNLLAISFRVNFECMNDRCRSKYTMKFNVQWNVWGAVASVSRLISS